MAKKRRLKKIKKIEENPRRDKKNFRLVVRNIVIFAVLSVISFIAYGIVSEPTYVYLFYAALIVSGALTLAFVLVLLILLILKGLKKQSDS